MNFVTTFQIVNSNLHMYESVVKNSYLHLMEERERERESENKSSVRNQLISNLFPFEDI